MHTSGTESPQRLDEQQVLALLTRQRDLYRELKSLADRQRGVVTSSEPEALLTILAERQKVVNRISGLDGDMKAVRAAWPELSEAMPLPAREQADVLIREVQSLLADILAGDDQDAKLLSARKQSVRAESQTMAAAKRAHAAYGAATVTGSPKTAGARFLDQMDDQA